MNRRIKQVWLLAILSSFLLIGLQTYWLYNSVTYSMGEMGKKNAEKAEQAIVTYQTNIGEAVKEKSHIGYVVTAYFSDSKRPCTSRTVNPCSRRKRIMFLPVAAGSMTGNDTRLIFSASLVNFPVGDFSIANFKQKNNYFHQIVMKLQQEVLCNTHFVQLERHSLLFRHYAFVDTKDYLADQLFIQEKVRVYFR